MHARGSARDPPRDANAHAGGRAGGRAGARTPCLCVPVRACACVRASCAGRLMRGHCVHAPRCEQLVRGGGEAWRAETRAACLRGGAQRACAGEGCGGRRARAAAAMPAMAAVASSSGAASAARTDNAPMPRQRRRSWVTAKSAALRLGRRQAGSERGGSTKAAEGDAAPAAEMAAEAGEDAAPAPPPTPPPPSSEGWVPVLSEGDLEKGTRKQTTVSGFDMMLFWYKNQIRAIESRSPAEGAYSEGFMNAKFTQDDSIICPSTMSEFDLNTGEVRSWYPTNTVLRKITPQCRPMDVFQVQVASGAIYVKLTPDAAAAAESRPNTDGGAGTSAEGNNVYGIEPKMWIDNREDGLIEDDAAMAANIDGNKLLGGIIAIAFLGVAGTAYPLVTMEPPQSYYTVAAVWVTLFGAVAAFAAKTTLKDVFEDE